jgi:hypothetical protein
VSSTAQVKRQVPVIYDDRKAADIYIQREAELLPKSLLRMAGWTLRQSMFHSLLVALRLGFDKDKKGF